LELNDLKGAHEWRRRSLQGRRTLYGEDHVLNHESINLARRLRDCRKRKWEGEDCHGIWNERQI